MPLTGERKRDYMREYMRLRRNPTAVRAVADAITAAVNPPLGRPRKQTPLVEQAAQAGLALALRSNRLDLDTVLSKVAEKLTATRWFNASRVENGKSVTEAIVAGDNDAQLRAAELAIELHQRAGSIPATTSHGPTIGSVTVNLVRFGAEHDKATCADTRMDIDVSDMRSIGDGTQETQEEQMQEGQ